MLTKFNRHEAAIPDWESQQLTVPSPALQKLLYVWQVAMGKSTQEVLEASGVYVYRADSHDEVTPSVGAALSFAYNTGRSVAVLIGQRVIGTKNFNK